MAYKLGILDQSPILRGKSAFDSLQHTIQLAQKAEEWGYDRFWVAEHHHNEQLAGSSPEVLISHLLARTNTIQIGAGGVMLQHYSPYKVAENFHVLATLAPGRVDLGVGKAAGGFPLSTKALQYGTINDGRDFDERLTFLGNIINDAIEQEHPLAGIQALPKPPESPDIFLLGASANSARLAASLGINFVFAGFLNSGDKILEEAVHAFREKSHDGSFIMAVAALAAPTQKEADTLVWDNQLFQITLSSGRTLRVQSQDQLREFEKQTKETFKVEEKEAGMIAGTPSVVKAELDRLHQTYQIDEFILHTPIQQEAERMYSFQLLRPS